MKTAIHWFRRDLRITDNTAFAAALKQAEQVVPVYIRSDWSTNHRWTGARRQEFLCGCLHSLAANIEALGGKFLVRQGKADRELEKLVKESGAEAIFFNRDPDPFGRAMEDNVRRMARKLRIAVHDFKDAAIHERDEILTGSGDPYRVFTPYSKNWAQQPKPEVQGRPRTMKSPSSLKSLPLPGLEGWGLEPSGAVLPESGEKAARTRLTDFLSGGIAEYGKNRNMLDVEGTSRISQDLRFGLLSIREVYTRCQKLASDSPATVRSNIQKYIGELIWREFYFQILWHFPNVLEEEFNPVFRGMPWPGRKADFERWKNAETGFPIVDAAMRELSGTGFMHNRARMIVAMFLTKDLHLDWRLGEQWFMQMLTDGEIASNNGGWQWSAGTGADAAPYFRIQNPWRQAETYDPEAKYIKRWLPELRDVPTQKLTRPSGAKLAKNYPLPMVDHAEARQRTLELFSSAKARGSGV